MKRIPLSRGIYLIPNLCTTGSLFCGFYSIVRSLSDDYWKAAIAIFIASIFDMLDGRIARMTHSESDFGVEYDSLVDLASFGLAPSILLYTWGLEPYHRIGWLAAFVYFACGALRLARYNVQIETLEKKRFQGLPIPLAALTLASFVILCQTGLFPKNLQGPLSLILPFVLALLMVSKIRYRSFKDLDFKSRDSFYVLVGAVGVILIIAMDPDRMPFFVFITYIISGLVEELFALRSSKRSESKIREAALRKKTGGGKLAILPSEEER